MDIYSPVVIDDIVRKNFKPTRLYIKESMGLKYFGKSILQNIDHYTGSGKRWRNHIKKYGKHTIKTIWVSDWYTTPESIQDFAISFSKEHNIVESEEWANLIAENGLSGGPVLNNHFATSDYNLRARTSESNKKRSDTLKGRKDSESVRLKNQSQQICQNEIKKLENRNKADCVTMMAP